MLKNYVLSNPSLHFVPVIMKVKIHWKILSLYQNLSFNKAKTNYRATNKLLISICSKRNDFVMQVKLWNERVGMVKTLCQTG